MKYYIYCGFYYKKGYSSYQEAEEVALGIFGEGANLFEIHCLKRNPN